MTTDSDKIRSFIGIKPSDAVLTFIKAFKQRHINDAWAKQIRWTAEPNIHLTMSFLGDLTEDQINQLESGLRILSENQSTFEITLTTPQAFPSAKKARILASLILKNQSLQQLAADIETLAISAGAEQEDRPFRGHITIGRFRQLGKDLEELANETCTVTMPVNQIILYKSDLKPTGAEYTEIAKFLLGSRFCG